jgi:hypothetical protein
VRYRTPLRTRLCAASFVILVIGLTAGMVIYLMAEDEAVNLAIHEMTIFKNYMRVFSAGTSLAQFLVARRLPDR